MTKLYYVVENHSAASAIGSLFLQDTILHLLNLVSSVQPSPALYYY
jgi:hypothetical protein